eukprot:CAMPEP_0197242870 /NCGR_PEP_ID=MMETSP1429-20130617/8478_1 /TAXON_ID=49237 /ORGANISM="Chaetoceros  sp., Strain UNC1202" /LENGTH=208 /DNA_ID=CAMNT_0042702971 /DNA_START=305 /DNA_END=932 /DNA_ORIENTATION=-
MTMPVTEDTPLTTFYESIQASSTFEEIEDISGFRPSKSHVLFALALLTSAAAVVGYSRGFTAETAHVASSNYYPSEEDPFDQLMGDLPGIFDEVQDEVSDMIDQVVDSVKHVNWTVYYDNSTNYTKDDDFDPLDLFNFFPQMNSLGFNMKKTNGTTKDIAKECFEHPNCTAFNTDGWMKNCVKNQSEWSALGEDPDDGLYVQGFVSYY